MAIKHPYYNYDKLLSYNCMFNFIAGGRGIGKTYGAQKMVIRKGIKTAVKDAIASGEQFMYVRRYKDELKIAKNTFFAAVEREFPNHDFKVDGMEGLMAPTSTRGVKGRQWITIGYFQALSVAQQIKSAAFPNVTMIIFDEFIIEKGHTRYLPDEWKVFLNLYNTVDRGQDKTRVLFLANAVSMMNPYYIALGLEPDQMGEVTVINDKFGNPYAVVHHPDSDEFADSILNQTRFGKFIAGTEYAEYAVHNQFGDAGRAMVGPKGGEARYIYTLETKTGTFSVWRVPHEDEYFIQARLPKEQLILTMDASRMTKEKVLARNSDKIIANLRTAFGGGRVTFDKTSTRNVFAEIFK